MIDEEREEINVNLNTAQQQLKNILETMNRTTTMLSIKEELFGPLDFSILKDYGFENIKYIILKKGKITNITGLPKGLKSIMCRENLLIELKDLPSSLITIMVEHNHLKSIDLSNLSNLNNVVLSHNEISTLENLPKSLVSLKCDHNKIGRLNLSGLEKLNVLHVSNNPITIIENLPEGISDFQMENTPSIEFRNVSGIPTPALSTTETNDDSENIDYQDALNNYFKMKTKYENYIYKTKKSIFDNEPNKKLAKKKVSEIKPKCINCKRPVGTIFSNGKKDRRYSAICGDTDINTRCGLNIVIFTGDYMNLEYMLDLFKEEVDEIKDTIIKQKLKTLFNYISEESSVRIFKKELQSYTENSEVYKQILDTYNNVHNNKEKKLAINKKITEIFRLIEHNRELLTEYQKTNNREILMNSLDLQIKQIAPEIRNLRLLKNEIMEIDNETNRDEFKLIRYPNMLNTLEYISGEPPRVIKYRL